MVAHIYETVHPGVGEECNKGRRGQVEAESMFMYYDGEIDDFMCNDCIALKITTRSISIGVFLHQLSEGSFQRYSLFYDNQLLMDID